VRFRRLRLHLALVYALVSAASIGGLAWYAVSAGTHRLQQQAESDLQSQLNHVIGQYDAARPPANEYDTWVVDTAQHRTTPLGQVDVEPPIQTVIAEADQNGGSATDRFDQSGTSYLISAQRVLNTPEVLVAASGLSDTEAAIDKLRWHIGLLAAAVVLVTTAAAYLLSAWALRPARRASDQQRQFLAYAAHELRTPVAVIQATAGQALQHPRSSDEYMRALSEVTVAAQRAGIGVADLLDLARLESRHVSLRRELLRLDLLVEEVCAAVVAVPQAEHATIDGVPVIVFADHGLLRQAIDNIVRNAAGRAGRVTVTVTARRKEAVVIVADDGPGFDPGFLPHAFDPFQRDPGGGAQEGSGLGLALVRQVAEAHHGRVVAVNGAQGGATIELYLPLPARSPVGEAKALRAQ